MKIFYVFALIGIFSVLGTLSAFADSNWVQLSSTQFFDVNSKNIQQNYYDCPSGSICYSAWMYELNNGFKDRDKNILYTKSMGVYNCSNKTVATKSFVNYDSKGNIVGTQFLVPKSLMVFYPIVPGSVGEYELDYACGYLKTPAQN